MTSPFEPGPVDGKLQTMVSEAQLCTASSVPPMLTFPCASPKHPISLTVAEGSLTSRKPSVPHSQHSQAFFCAAS